MRFNSHPRWARHSCWCVARNETPSTLHIGSGSGDLDFLHGRKTGTAGEFCCEEGSKDGLH